MPVTELRSKLPGTVADVWAQEKAALMPMPRPFDGFVEHTKRVSPTCLVHFERNRYSVPAPYANCGSTQIVWWSLPKARSSVNTSA